MNNKIAINNNSFFISENNKKENLRENLKESKKRNNKRNNKWRYVRTYKSNALTFIIEISKELKWIERRFI